MEYGGLFQFENQIHYFILIELFKRDILTGSTGFTGFHGPKPILLIFLLTLYLIFKVRKQYLTQNAAYMKKISSSDDSEVYPH